MVPMCIWSRHWSIFSVWRREQQQELESSLVWYESLSVVGVTCQELDCVFCSGKKTLHRSFTLNQRWQRFRRRYPVIVQKFIKHEFSHVQYLSLAFPFSTEVVSVMSSPPLSVASWGLAAGVLTVSLQGKGTNEQSRFLLSQPVL